MGRFGPALLFAAVLGLSAAVGANAAPFAYIPNASGNDVSVIDTATNAIVATVGVGDRPYGAAVSPDGSRVYVANYAGQSVSVIDAATNAVTATVALPLLGAFPLGVAVAPDGSRVYVTAVPDGFFVIDTATNAVVSAQSLPGDPFGVAVAPDGSRVYVTNHSPAVLVIDAATNAVVRAVTVGSTVDQTHGVAVTPDGARVYVTTYSEEPYGHFGVAAIDTATNTVVTTIPLPPRPKAITVAPDVKHVYVANSNAVNVVDTSTNAVVATVGPMAFPTGLAVTPDGARVYVTHAYTTPRGTVDAIDTSRNLVVATVEVGSLPLAYGQFIQPRIPSFPFASFQAQLAVGRETGSFVVKGTFALGTGSRGINPVTQPLTLGIGGFTAVIPAGSFREDRYGMFVFEGVINGAPLAAVVVRHGGNRFAFKAEGVGAGNLPTANPVPLRLGIGSNAGTTTVTVVMR